MDSEDRAALQANANALIDTPLTVWAFIRPGNQFRRMGNRFASRNYCENSNATTLGLGDLLLGSTEMSGVYGKISDTTCTLSLIERFFLLVKRV